MSLTTEESLICACSGSTSIWLRRRTTLSNIWTPVRLSRRHSRCSGPGT
jgi:hypothetical protein